MTESDCPFCHTLANASWDEEELVWHFPHSVALLGPWQFYHGYCLLLSRQHARELSELPDLVRREYLEEMCLLARAIEQTFHAHKLNYELLGNQVPHLHWHLFPRSADDPARLQPVWLALDAASRDPALRQQLQTGPEPRLEVISRLRQTLSSLKAPMA